MKRINFLGIEVDLLTLEHLNTIVRESILTDKKVIIANHNLHSIYISNRSNKLQTFFSKVHFIHIDGMSLIYIAKLIGFNISRRYRVTYVDWMKSLFTLANQNKWRVFYLGSTEESINASKSIFSNNYPGIVWLGHSGYFNFDSKENIKIVQKINNFRPNILMVGMGMPRQESWISNEFDSLNANVILPCGAALDYLVGNIKTPPRWMGLIGFEWLFRLIDEPKRLWRRYLVEPWFVFGLIIKELYSTKKGIQKKNK